MSKKNKRRNFTRLTTHETMDAVSDEIQGFEYRCVTVIYQSTTTPHAHTNACKNENIIKS